MRECREDFANWHDDVLEVFDCLDVPYKWALIGRPPLEHCSVGRVTLLGDACHPTLPTLGQGANMTMEDAMILERCLEASTDVAETLKRYETSGWIGRRVSCGVRSIVLSECATSNLPTPIRRRHSWIGSSLPPGLAISMTGFTNTMR